MLTNSSLIVTTTRLRMFFISCRIGYTSSHRRPRRFPLVMPSSSFHLRSFRKTSSKRQTIRAASSEVSFSFQKGLLTWTAQATLIIMPAASYRTPLPSHGSTDPSMNGLFPLRQPAVPSDVSPNPAHRTPGDFCLRTHSCIVVPFGSSTLLLSCCSLRSVFGSECTRYIYIRSCAIRQKLTAYGQTGA